MIPLYTYVDAFLEGKLRPGFRVEGKLFVLTSSRPRVNYMLLQDSCCSGHFASRGKKYVTLASNQQAYRYNNVVGGYLTLDVEKFEARFNISINDYLTTNHINNMSKLTAFATLNGFFLVADPTAYGQAANLEGDALKMKLGLETEGKPRPEDFTTAYGWTALPEGAKWGEKFQSVALQLAREAFVEELSQIKGQATAQEFSTLIDDTSLPEMIEVVKTFQATPEDPAVLATFKSHFGEPTPETVENIDPEAIAEALAENQAPIAEGVPAEELVEPTVIGTEVEEQQDDAAQSETAPEIQVNPNLPANTPVKQGAAALVNIAANAVEARLKDAVELKKLADNRLDEALQATTAFHKEATVAIEKLLGGAEEPVSELAETVDA